ncbi:hypothetical protein STHU_10030 [Allostella humosa]|nr:hypothetical protein [Stella humosa]BBK30369.1 hypothetical protein STHU_10030 [Stella humosa]
MAIDGRCLPNLAQLDFFVDEFVAYCDETLDLGKLRPHYSISRIRDAHHAWRDDLARVGAAEPNLAEGMDHLKQCGHLAYWLRRMAPVIDYEDVLKAAEDDPEPYPEEAAFRSMITGYGTEYLAFDFGRKICSIYEELRVDRGTPFQHPAITATYIKDTCHMLKFKHVSPHSMYLIYRSLFL